MQAKSKRVLKCEVQTGQVRLGDGLEFLSRAEYSALSRQKVGRKLEWHAEILLSTFADLLKTKERYAKLRSRFSELKKAHEQLLLENTKLVEKTIAVSAINLRLMRNIEEDKRPDKFFRSPKNYLNAAEDHAFKVRSTLPLQGGLAGIEKK